MVLEYFLKRTQRAEEIKGWCSALKNNPSYPGPVQGELSMRMGEKEVSARGKMGSAKMGWSQGGVRQEKKRAGKVLGSSSGYKEKGDTQRCV